MGIDNGLASWYNSPCCLGTLLLRLLEMFWSLWSSSEIVQHVVPAFTSPHYFKAPHSLIVIVAG